jgi:hypothetical protein
MGPTLGRGPASRSAVRSSGGTPSVREPPICPRPSLRRTSVQASWWTLTRANAPPANGAAVRSRS